MFEPLLLLMLEVYKVEFDYTPAKSDELSLVKNQFLTVLQAESADWWIMYNLNKQQIGWVPLNFLKRVEHYHYQCDYEYTAENDDELSLKEGDPVIVLDKNTSIDGWYLAMIESFTGSVELLVQEQGLKYNMYKVGLVPSNFVSAKSKPNKIPTGGVALPKNGTVILKSTQPKTVDREEDPVGLAHKSSISYLEQNKTGTMKKNQQSTSTYVTSVAYSPSDKSATIKKLPPSIQTPQATATTIQRKDDSAKYVKNEDFPLKEKESVSRKESVVDIKVTAEHKKSTIIEKKEIACQTGGHVIANLEDLQWYVDDQLLSLKSEMYSELEKIRKASAVKK
eukprot:NODE_175_length_14138_cov_1.015314.p6 type:complete len:337 gc:universal NODE_175_length_14138_cov_1.015314:4603-3593(-)